MSGESKRRRPEVAAGMAAAKERGVRVGRPPGPVPESGARAAELQAAGMSLAQIAVALADEGIPTPSGQKSWSRAAVQSVIRRYRQAQGEESAGQGEPDPTP